MNTTQRSKEYCSGGRHNHYGLTGDVIGSNSGVTVHVNCIY